ncbi:MAG: DUF2007 domain-containing protein [Cyclobacteriaceae bacterium]
MSNWQKVYQADDEHRAEIVRAVLADRDFNPIMLNKKDSTYHFGHFEVLVAPEHVIRALKIINEEIKFE